VSIPAQLSVPLESLLLSNVLLVIALALISVLAVAQLVVYSIIVVRVWRSRASVEPLVGSELAVAYVITVVTNVVPLLLLWGFTHSGTSL
jgi:hypothetical protein